MHIPRLALLFVSGVALTYAGNIVAQARDEGDGKSWQVTAGAGVLARPDFPGSDSLEVLPLPAFNITYGERWFLNADGLGAYLVKRDRGSVTFSLAPDVTRRDESDSSHLRGLGDVDRTAVARLKTAYSFGPVTATAAVSTDIADEGHGTVAELALQSRAEVTQRLALNYGVAARWIDDEYAESFFGVTAQQSLRSGLSEYEAQNGVGDARLFVNAVYALSPRWIVSAGAAAAQLQGDAKDSPIVEDDSYFQFDAAVMYRF
ncbi:MAG TPA: MipA/OmpV family protein [Steroidobacter sp.]|uniref:MipA/OmpV family protein n=1 Tax=Steroidobacter sp. TaxID=1978227 RepID=UPI002ED9A3D7